MGNSNKLIKQTAKTLIQLEDVFLLCHRKPDGDTLGSAIALKYALAECGVRSEVFCSDPVTEKLAFLGEIGDFENPPFEMKHAVAVDVASTELLGDLVGKIGGIDVVIDHHPSNSLEARMLSCVLPEYAACGEIVAEILEELEVGMSPGIATALYTAISTDTGCFRYSNTTAGTHAITAGILAEYPGLTALNRPLFSEKTRARIELESILYSRMQYFAHGLVAVTYITREDRLRIGADDDDFDDIGSIPRSVKGVEIGFFLNENRDGTFRVSARSNVEADVSSICGKFGGGGHKRAAGCTLIGPVEAAVARLVVEAEEAVKMIGSGDKSEKG